MDKARQYTFSRTQAVLKPLSVIVIDLPLAWLCGVGQLAILVGLRQVFQPTLPGEPSVQEFPIFLWSLLPIVCSPPLRSCLNDLRVERRVGIGFSVLRFGFVAFVLAPVNVPEFVERVPRRRRGWLVRAAQRRRRRGSLLT
jgi:hypothetical protein